MSVNREILLARGMPAASRAVMPWRGVSRFCRSAVFLSLSFSPCEAVRQTTEHSNTAIIGGKQAGQGFRGNIKHFVQRDSRIFQSVKHTAHHCRINIEINRLRGAANKLRTHRSIGQPDRRG
ncbi:hypothetical protein, partial [Burkholderia multivorans]|uniref:hypothetical protein n=1 Tax=Burkholderia multivorans TaxID=87883 RepID=UPI001C65BCA3